MGNEIFEEIKQRYKKSNKYMLCVSYEDIGILIQIIEKQTKEIEELKDDNKKLTDEYLVQRDLINPDFLKDYISKDKIKAKIEEYEKKEKDEPDAFLCKKVLQSLLEKE